MVQIGMVGNFLHRHPPGLECPSAEARTYVRRLQPVTARILSLEAVDHRVTMPKASKKRNDEEDCPDAHPKRRQECDEIALGVADHSRCSGRVPCCGRVCRRVCGRVSSAVGLPEARLHLLGQDLSNQRPPSLFGCHLHKCRRGQRVGAKRGILELFRGSEGVYKVTFFQE